MSDIQTLKSYLVGLGFSVDAQQYKKFNDTLVDAARTVTRETTSIGASLIKWQIGIIGLFTTVSTAILGTIDKVAQADQEYRLFGERMFISTNNARSLKIALDALGQPMEAIAFDPELHERFMQLQKDQMRMGKGLGGDFESNMRGIRDISFELTRLKVELQYLAMGTVSNIFKGLFGDGDVLKKLREWNEWLITNLPNLSKQFSTYIIPVLKDTWRILTDVGKLLGILGMEFSNFVGIISGDSSLEGTAFNFDKLARSVGKVVGWIATLLDWLIKLEQHFPVLEIIGGAAAGAALGSVVPGVGTGAGAIIGGLAGGITGMVSRINSGDTKSVVNSSNDLSSFIKSQEGRMPQQYPSLEGGADTVGYGHKIKTGEHFGVLTDAQMDSLLQKDIAEARGTVLAMTKGMNLSPGMIDALTDMQFGSTGGLAKATTLMNHLRSGDTNAAANDFLLYGGYHDKNGVFHPGGTDRISSTLLKRRMLDKQMALGLSKYNASSSMGTSGASKPSGTITIGDINIMQPNASADEIANTVTSKIQQQQDKQNQRNLTELTPVFQ